MHSGKSASSILVLVVALCSSGCTYVSTDKVYQAYPDKKLDASQISKITAIQPSGCYHVFISSIDHSLTYLPFMPRPGEVDVLPGPHRLSITHKCELTGWHADAKLWVITEAGKVYSIHDEGDSYQRKIWITDPDGKTVGGIEGSADEPAIP